MVKLNHLQYSKLSHLELTNEYSMSALVENHSFENLCREYKEHFNYTKIKTFAFTKEGFLGLLLELKGTIAISLGETQALIDAGKQYASLGFKVIWLELYKDGNVNVSALNEQKVDFLFLSSYVSDTFFKINLQAVKNFTNATLISNATAYLDTNSDVIYFDPYKLFGFNTNGVVLFNHNEFELMPVGQIDTLSCSLALQAKQAQHFNKALKPLFLEKLKATFQENIYFFVNPENTLSYTLHFGLKGIKAREFIRTLALNSIFISNGEGCSLGMSKPSRVIQAMGYDEASSRNAIVLSFVDEMSEEEVDKLVRVMYLKYKQIKSFNE